MAKTVYAIEEGYITFPFTILDRTGTPYQLISTEVTHFNGSPISTPAWFDYRTRIGAREDGYFDFTILYRFLASAVPVGEYTISVTYLPRNGSEATRTFKIDREATVDEFSPSDIPDLIFWSNGGAVFYPRHGDVVRRLPNLHYDIDGTVEYVGQDEIEKKPRLVLNEVGGKPGIYFDSDDKMRIDYPLGHTRTVFLVFRFTTSLVTFNGKELLSWANGGYLRYRFDSFSNGRTGGGFDEDGVYQPGEYTGYFWELKEGNQSKWEYFNKIPVSHTTGAQVLCLHMDWGLELFLNGLSRGIGLRSSATTPYLDFGGYGVSIAEIIVYDRGLTNEQRNNVTAMLGQKYGVSVFSGKFQDPVDYPDVTHHYSPASYNGQSIDYGGYRVTRINNRVTGGLEGIDEKSGIHPFYGVVGSGPTINERVAGELNGAKAFKFWGDFLKVNFLSDEEIGTSATFFLATNASNAGDDEGWLFDGIEEDNRCALGLAQGKVRLLRETMEEVSHNLSGAYLIWGIIKPTGQDDEIYVNNTRILKADTGGNLWKGPFLGAGYEVWDGYDPIDPGILPVLNDAFLVGDFIIGAGNMEADDMNDIRNFLYVKYGISF